MFISIVVQGMKLLIIIVCKLTVWLYLSNMKTVIQQNSFNLTSFNLEILIILNLNRVVSRLEILLFVRKKLYQLNRQISGTCSERPPSVS